MTNQILFEFDGQYIVNGLSHSGGFECLHLLTTEQEDELSCNAQEERVDQCKYQADNLIYLSFHLGYQLHI